jgi:hypothetical protein
MDGIFGIILHWISGLGLKDIKGIIYHFFRDYSIFIIISAIAWLLNNIIVISARKRICDIAEINQDCFIIENKSDNKIINKHNIDKIEFEDDGVFITTGKEIIWVRISEDNLNKLLKYYDQ